MHNPALEHVWKEEGEKMELTDDLQCNRFVLKLPPEPKWNSYGYRRFTVITFVSVCCRNTEPLPSPRRNVSFPPLRLVWREQKKEGGTPAGARGGPSPQTAKHADGTLSASTRHSRSVRTIYRSTEAACAQTPGWRWTKRTSLRYKHRL